MGGSEGMGRGVESGWGSIGWLGGGFRWCNGLGG